jgi:Na+/H+ antiporter NhaD/arsenite permease-like protein|tara:strand:- start:537 stop:2144 length:1608 start_codon:yes stop_codon:yes gene_type:complete
MGVELGANRLPFGRWIVPSILAGIALVPTVLAGSSSSQGVWEPPEMPSWALMVSIAILFGVYTLIVFEWVHRALAAALGAVLVVCVLHYIGDGPSLGTLVTWIDEETVGLLLGMMIMVSVLSETGLFQWAAVKCYALSGGSVWRLVVILCLVTAVFSAFLDNVTTMLLIAPVTISLAKVLRLDPIPILLSEVMFSNIGGAATQIGDPPNIIIGAQLSPSALAGGPLEDQAIVFTDFIINIGPGVLLAFLPGLWLLHKIEREGVTGQRYRSIEMLQERYKIKDYDMLKRSGFVFAIVLIAFFIHSAFHHPLFTVATIALGGSVLMLLVTHPHRIEERLDDVEWTTLIFFIGLFILIHGLEAMGLIDAIGDFVTGIIKSAPEDMRLMTAVLLLLWVSAFASAFIDNIPYTATMVPVVIGIASDPELGLALAPLAWALSFGACLGGNGTIIGASANVVTAGIAEDAGYPISFNRFFKVGFPMMLVTMVVVTAYSMVMYVIEWSNPIYPWIICLVAFILMLIVGLKAGPKSDVTRVEEE